MKPLDNKPWERLLELLDRKQPFEIIKFLNGLSAQETALVLSRLSENERTTLLTLLSPTEAAELIEDISDEQAALIISELPPASAGKIIDELPSEQVVDVLGEMASSEAEEILQTMEPGPAEEARNSLSYPKDTAGNLMIRDFLSFGHETTIGQVNADLQAQKDRYQAFHIHYIYVVDDDQRLVGVMRIHDLLFSSSDSTLHELMITNPYRIPGSADLDQVSEYFDQFSLLALPVVDEQDQLLGVILPMAVEEAKSKRSVKQYLWLSGIIGGEEFRSMPLLTRSGRRLSWLSLNIVLNIIAASVIALYQDTLAAAIALAVFLPMVSDMSGCSGNQAVAVSLRELALGLLRPGEIFRVAMKESMLGVVNGIALGILLGFVAYLWKGNIYLSLVIGTALAANTVVAVTFGGVLPLVLKKLKIDPALVSSPLLTTVTDMCGFFLVLSLASAVLPRISS
jgi:magnesium transporter